MAKMCIRDRRCCLTRNGSGKFAYRLIKNASVPANGIGVLIILKKGGAALAVQIMAVVPGSPADTAGIRPGEKLTAINQNQIDDILERFNEISIECGN